MEQASRAYGIIRYVLGSVLAAVVMVCAALTVSAQTLGVVTANNVNVRDAGSLTDSNVLYMVNNGQAVSVIDVTGEYYQLNVNEDQNVYIAREYVKITQTDALIVEDNAMVYEVPPETGSESPIGQYASADIVTVTASCGDWYIINFKGVSGYISKQSVCIPTFVTLPESPYRNANTEQIVEVSVTSIDDDVTDAIIAYAKKFLGAKYVYGGMSPQKGFDCSGFVNYVLKEFNISLSRSSSSMSSEGTSVSKNELQKCDLVFFATSGGKRISHVGLYIGNGQFIHSSTNGSGVVISSLSEKYYANCYVKATRVL